MTSARQIYLGSRRGPALPYDAEVEWLESTGTQWIDTGVIATNDLHINLRFNDCTSKGTWLFGARIAYKNSALGVYSSTQAVDKWLLTRGDFVSSSSFEYATSGVGIVTFDYAGATFTATRELQPETVTFTDTAPTFSSSPYTMYLWTVNLAGAVGYVAVAKMYGVKIWSGGNLIRDLIPVRFTNELGQSEGAMYDRVSGQLFRNAGTGVFGFGTDIAGGGYKCLGYSPLRCSRFSRLWKEAA